MEILTVLTSLTFITHRDIVAYIILHTKTVLSFTHASRLAH